MMSQIHCKQSIRIEKSGWFKHYFPGNLRRNILFKVCNYTSYQNLQKTSLPNPFAREKAGDKAGTVSREQHKIYLCLEKVSEIFGSPCLSLTFHTQVFCVLSEITLNNIVQVTGR